MPKFCKDEKLLNSKTRFIAIPHVSNSLGTVVPIKIIIDIAHSLGIPVLVDGAQGIPTLKLSFKNWEPISTLFPGTNSKNRNRCIIWKKKLAGRNAALARQ